MCNYCLYTLIIATALPTVKTKPNFHNMINNERDLKVGFSKSEETLQL